MVVFNQPLVSEILHTIYIVCFNAVVLIVFLSSLDDFFIDCLYIVRRAYRSLFIKSRYAAASDKSLSQLRKKQKPFAICVPAWKEANVIAAMLERAVRDIRYDNYRIFVGVYANDAKTRAAVDDLRRRNHDCAHRVITVPHPANGPTNKADCLNSIYTYVHRHDAWAGGGGVVGFILHDAEDIIHPSELVVFNHLIERADMIQLPVVPLARPLTDLVGGHYQDDFAESHTKDLVVREALGCGLPSAGVGCAFSAESLASLAMLRNGRPFDAQSVTEDYDIALDLCTMGYRSMFVRMPSVGAKRSFVATQEYFPNSFGAAIRQKSRWLLGISLQSWTKRGWHGSLAERYMLWRDRKSLLTAITSLLAYALLLVFVLRTYIQDGTISEQWIQLAPPGGIVYALLWANLAFLANRIIQRFAFVYRSYGLTQALISPFRIIVGNIINFFSAWRAARLFHKAEKTGKRSFWGKTDHQIPTTDDIVAQPGAR